MSEEQERDWMDTNTRHERHWEAMRERHVPTPERPWVFLYCRHTDTVRISPQGVCVTKRDRSIPGDANPYIYDTSEGRDLGKFFAAPDRYVLHLPGYDSALVERVVKENGARSGYELAAALNLHLAPKKPEGYVYSYRVDGDTKALGEALARGERAQMDEPLQDHYLNVLPPRFMGRVVELVDGTKVYALFGFAEGEEPIVAFWTDRTTGRHFAQRTKLIARG